MKRTLISLFSLLVLAFSGQALNYSVSSAKQVYKEIDGHKLELSIYRPDIKGDIALPAIVFFFGGGWVAGTPDHFKFQAEYLASRGMVVICPDYRTQRRHNTSPFECVKDAKSAMRYIKSNAAALHIDPDRIVAAGGSAGGHLAASTAILDYINEENENTEVSTVPFALILFNPVVDTSKRGYGRKKVEGREFEISPVHHIRPDIPPTLIMHGKDDTTVPYENVVRFKYTMKQSGNECKLIGYKKQSHGFFNYDRKPKYFKKTLQAAEDFLERLELLRGESWVKQYLKSLEGQTT